MSIIENKSNINSTYSLPDGSQHNYSTVSNTTKTENLTTGFVKTRSSEKLTATNSEEVKQILKLTNNSTLEIKNIRIKEFISANGKIKTGSVEIDGTKYENFDPNVGFTLPNSILSKAETTITYVLVVDDAPKTDVINMLSEITYNTDTSTDIKENSNTLVINLDYVSVSINKSSSATVAIKGQTLIFEHTIRNDGNLAVTNVMFKDPLPADVTFVENSVTIDGETKSGYNPVTGFSVKDLNLNDQVVIKFNVVVNWWKKL